MNGRADRGRVADTRNFHHPSQYIGHGLHREGTLFRDATRKNNPRYRRAAGDQAFSDAPGAETKRLDESAVNIHRCRFQGQAQQ